MDVSVEIMNSVDRLVHQKIRPMSVEPERRLSFENWKKHKTLEHFFRQQYLKKKLAKKNDVSGYLEKGGHEKTTADENANAFQDWIKKKIIEKKRERKEKRKIKDEKKARQMKMQGGGLSYKQWLKISLAKEKDMRKKQRIEEELLEYKRSEVEEQKKYEKQAMRYIEKKKINERLSRLSIRKPAQSSEDRYHTHSPLLLAYSPNKHNKMHEQSLIQQSKFSSHTFDDY